MCSAPERLLIWYATQKMCTLNQYLSILRISRCAYAQHLKYMLWAYDTRNIYYLPIRMCIRSASVMRSITCDQQYAHNIWYILTRCAYAQHLLYDVCEHVNMLTISIKMWCTDIPSASVMGSIGDVLTLSISWYRLYVYTMTHNDRWDTR